jgi:class 3 adenylate cyclase/pimeloyl-ACP methyl ester carboxylesterase
VKDRPETKFAWNGDVALAYQVFGQGPVDLVYCQGYASHIDLNWESPHLARFLRGLGRLARVIHTDRRGFGCSDRFSPGDVAAPEVQVDDLIAVMDTAGSERAVVFGSWETGLASMLLAATFPERVAGLVLCDSFVTYCASEETPWMWSVEQWEEINDAVRTGWGTPAWVEDAFPDEREFLDWFVPWTRASVAPGALVAEGRAFYRVDARSALSSIHAPTLVIGMPEEEIIRENARFIAARIAGSRLIEPSMVGGASMVGGDASHHWYARAPVILEAVGELISEVREEQASFDRVLATVLFTDIVNSTATAATSGDANWRVLLEEHDRIAKGIIGRFRGIYVRGTGDGLLATFDGPARGVRCAQALVEAVKPLGVEIRAGLHTGEIEYGGHDLAGVGVNIGARVGAKAGASEVWVSSTVKDLVVGSGLVFEDRGEHELKGVPAKWRLYAALPADA